MKLVDLFLKFFKLGASGWGGPIGRIAMMHEELVVKDKWITEEKFAKVLAVYQILPGPEATEIATYFGYSKLGRAGAIIAGLGFMLPGFLLMLILSYLYVSYGLQAPEANAILYGIRPVIVALILHEAYKLGKENIKDLKMVVLTAISSLLFLFTKIDFLIILPIAGLVSFFIYGGRLRENTKKMLAGIVFPAIGVLPVLPATVLLFVFFLKAGLLTFGGAYSVVPFIQHGAVYEYGWLTNEQYLDGLTLGSIVPSPLVIIATFTGYVAGGLLGAILATIGIFLPAFAFTLIGFKHIEKTINNKWIHKFLVGVIAAVIGLILSTWIELTQIAIIDIPTIALGIIAFYLIVKKKNFLLTVLGSGVAGILLKFIFKL